jgi:hypothetical protein
VQFILKRGRDSLSDATIVFPARRETVIEPPITIGTEQTIFSQYDDSIIEAVAPTETILKTKRFAPFPDGMLKPSVEFSVKNENPLNSELQILIKDSDIWISA